MTNGILTVEPALSGALFIGSTRRLTGAQYEARSALTGERLDPAFSIAEPRDIADACALAAAAFDPYRTRPAGDRAAFLRAIAEAIEGLGDLLIDRAHCETALPIARLTGERARTCAQLRLFADEVEDGGWQMLRIDTAQPDRQPLPRPELRMGRVPVGPVAVFGASNFPLAFSVAGGDTAAALAAGCPVVVKAHPAHPGTSELVAAAIVEAAEETAMPAGVFSLVAGPAPETGAALLADPNISAVGFTGSRAAGLALMRIAAARPVPIPVYAEMSSINPVLLLPAALAARPEALAAQFIGSMMLGVGQFCTNPGLVLALEGRGLDRFRATAAQLLERNPAAPMLTRGIATAYAGGVVDLERVPGVRRLATGSAGAEGTGQPILFETDAETFAGSEVAAREIFGPASLLVRCETVDRLADTVASLEGQLTATVHFDAGDEPAVAALLPLLERKAGRIVANGWPTGVEVAHAMVHGGPFPATSDGRSTSVGTAAMDRFTRFVCYQDMPERLLPHRFADSCGLLRQDGRWRLGKVAFPERP
jgi:NADP-dependent aldehyde dehydrogenase